MPQINIDKLQDRILYASGPVAILDIMGKVVATRKSGQVVGEVFSWINRDGTLYLTLKPMNPTRMVKVPNPNLSLSKTESREVFGKQEIEDVKRMQEIEEQKREAMGPIAYYVKKYGPILAAFIAGTYLLGVYIKKKA